MSDDLILKSDAAKIKIALHQQTTVRFLFLAIMALIAVLVTTFGSMYGVAVFLVMWVAMGFWLNKILAEVQYLHTKYALGPPINWKMWIIGSLKWRK